jgi:S1-C subfamily serine protease
MKKAFPSALALACRLTCRLACLSACLLAGAEGVAAAAAQPDLAVPPAIGDQVGHQPRKVAPGFTAAEAARVRRSTGTGAVLARAVSTPFSDQLPISRSPRDVALYRQLAPSVVLVATDSGLGSGSLVSSNGDILTNWHVVRGYRDVAIVFKPAQEGARPTRNDVVRGRVVKVDEVADLALVRVASGFEGRSPIQLGDVADIVVGSDVQAIGHPTGEAWSYTKGIVSQYRVGYEWASGAEGPRHRADVVQTQTPINPGNSGGPLLSETGRLLGVNSFKTAEGEGLNFAVSVDDVRKFFVRPSDRTFAKARTEAAPAPAACKPREVYRGRMKDNSGAVVLVDAQCTGRADVELITPDDPSKPVMLRLDRNQDGRPDVVIFDLKRRGRWDLSFWDNDFDGRWDLVGHHPDGSPEPSQYEGFEAYRAALAGR